MEEKKKEKDKQFSTQVIHNVISVSGSCVWGLEGRRKLSWDVGGQEKESYRHGAVMRQGEREVFGFSVFYLIKSRALESAMVGSAAFFLHTRCLVLEEGQHLGSSTTLKPTEALCSSYRPSCLHGSIPLSQRSNTTAAALQIVLAAALEFTPQSQSSTSAATTVAAEIVHHVTLQPACHCTMVISCAKGTVGRGCVEEEENIRARGISGSSSKGVGVTEINFRCY
uniref:Uncharacterized protein n=3 Tax=Oryza sativa TaxID=4530 RepID=Q6UU36_ORYSJ|nr:hypothetical protein OSJNBa0096K16.7 [Oryza sativa Japonica Group]